MGLIVTDWNGIKSEQTTCLVDIEPDEDLYVAMSWDTANTDLDLHMIPEGESMWGCNDCSWCNPDPDWFAAWGNPVYALDNTSGYGPENINVDNPGPFQYDIKAHYWADRGGGATRVTISVYILGELTTTITKTMTSRQQWDVGHVSFVETADGVLSGVFVDSDTEPFSASGSCVEGC